jgi:peptide-methionine (S)-S-oxide reductase
LGGGCFWCLEAVFERLDGIVAVDSGYAGGARPNPSYEQVCSGATGHAEVVRITFDSTVLSFEDILEVFFAFHDPTTLNRQGPDMGTQYRSVVFAESEEQEQTARAMIARLEAEGVFGDPIVTTVERLPQFWPAEEYHRQYFRRHPEQAYCRAMIAPKVAKLRSAWSHRLKGSS